jgi:hypothetical protein
LSRVTMKRATDVITNVQMVFVLALITYLLSK